MPGCTVIPELPYPDISEAIQWLTAAFGFTLRLQIADHRAQMNVGDGAVVLTEAPTTGSLPACHVMVRVEDVDAHCNRAEEHGGAVVNPPTSYPYGERQYTVRDFAGHYWHFSQSIADVDPSSWGGTVGVL